MSNKAHLGLAFAFLMGFCPLALPSENNQSLSAGENIPTSFMTDNLNLSTKPLAEVALEKSAQPKSSKTSSPYQNRHIGLQLLPHRDSMPDALSMMPPAPQYLETSNENIDIWERIREGFKIANKPSPLVYERINWYLKRKSYLEALLLRAKPYLHYILGELEKRKMPTELALLPFVESGFNPFATSHARATGLWQFIPSTGHSYQLKQDWWVDERRDIVASTEAALDYLNTLHAKFSSWRLALIAYNWGDGKLQRAIQHNIRHHRSTAPEYLAMPRETRYYIPSLEAIKYIVSNPEKYGVNLPSISNHPYLFATEVNIHLDVVTAARLAELPLKQFLYFNPSFQRPLINKAGQSPSIILLPVQKSDIFRRNLLVYRKSGTHSPNWTIGHYPKMTAVQKIAKKFHISANQILLSNGKNLKTKWIKGDILIPMNSEAWKEWTQQANSLHLHPLFHRMRHRRHHFIHKKHYHRYHAIKKPLYTKRHKTYVKKLSH